eukprot:jgi/Chrzof1/1818/Cz10g22100.t1
MNCRCFTTSTGSVPALGQAVQGISSGMAHISHLSGGIGQHARTFIHKLGIKGLEAGFGCGVGIGYGFGAGLMLKPSAWSQLCRSTTAACADVMHHARQRLAEAGIVVPQQQSGVVSLPAQHLPESVQHLPVTNPKTAWQHCQVTEAVAAAAAGHSAAAAGQGMGISAGTHQYEQLSTAGGPKTSSTHSNAHSATYMLQALLQQQVQINMLRRQNKALKAAVCKLDSSAPFCTAGALWSDE